MTLRELNSIQIIFDRLQKNGDNLFPKVSIIDSQIDFFKHKDKVLEAIHFWINIHPLLNSRIVAKNDKSYFEFDNQMNKNLNNVRFLRYISQNVDKLDIGWQLLVEHELSNSFISQTGPLWRLYIIKIKLNKYAFVLNFHHALTDGRNTLALFQQLLKIIENYCIDGKTNIKNDQSAFEFAFPNDYSLRFKNDKLNLDCINESYHSVIIPDAIKPSKNKKIEFNIDFNDKFVDENGNLFIESSKIRSKRDKNFTKIVFFHISKEDFLLITQECKTKGIKLTGFFEVICAIAWYKTLKKFTNASIISLKYDVTISMRPYLNPPLDNHTLGVYAPSKTIKYELNNDSEIENIWNLARKRTHELHSFIKSNQFFSDNYQMERERWFQALLNGKQVNDIEIFYYLTNLGKIDNNEYKFTQIKIENYYCISSFIKDSHTHGAFYSFLSCNENLSWSLSYNSSLFKNEFIQDLVECTNSYIKKILYSLSFI